MSPTPKIAAVLDLAKLRPKRLLTDAEAKARRQAERGEPRGEAAPADARGDRIAPPSNPDSSPL